jgi:hypothetical protein
MNEAGSRLDMFGHHAMSEQMAFVQRVWECLGHPSSKAFTYFKRGFITLQLLVDRYIIDWPSDVELTEECRKLQLPFVCF